MMAPRGTLARPLTTTLIAAMVVGSLVLVGGTANAADSCGYPSGTGRTATVFSESEVLRTFRIDTAKGTIQAFYNDEHALTLGENLNGFSITPFVATYAVRVSGSNAWHSGAVWTTPRRSVEPMRHTRARLMKRFSFGVMRGRIAHLARE